MYNNLPYIPDRTLLNPPNPKKLANLENDREELKNLTEMQNIEVAQTVKGTQHIHIKESKSHLQLNLPESFPLTKQVVSDPPVAKVQIQYASFPGNIGLDLGTDRILRVAVQIGIKVTEVGDTTPTTYYVNSFGNQNENQSYFELEIPDQSSRIMNADEIASALNKQIMEIRGLAYDKYTTYTIEDSNATNLHYYWGWVFFMHFKSFYFDSVKQKYVFQFQKFSNEQLVYYIKDPSDLQFKTKTPAFKDQDDVWHSMDDGEVMTLSDFTILVYTKPPADQQGTDKEEKKHKKLAALMGMATNEMFIAPDRIKDYYDYVSNRNNIRVKHFVEKLDAPPEEYMVYGASFATKENVFTEYHDLLRKPIPYFTTYPNGGLYVDGEPKDVTSQADILYTDDVFTAYGSYTPQVLGSHWVYVHTDLTATQWQVDENEKKKTTLMAIIPLQYPYSDERRMSDIYFQSDMFAVIDKVENIRKMQIWITDEDGDEINFRHHYHIGFLVFPVTAKTG